MLHIGLILSSTRPGRVSPDVGKWLLAQAQRRGDAHYELVDLADYNLPLLGASGAEEALGAWNHTLARLDGFVFVTAEYNHSITGALKNALDCARDAWQNKAAGIVSYGSMGGVRAAEHLRGILGELQIADVRTNPAFSLFTDFENGTAFAPADHHEANVQLMFDQLLAWSAALQPLRSL